MSLENGKFSYGEINRSGSDGPLMWEGSVVEIGLMYAFPPHIRIPVIILNLLILTMGLVGNLSVIIVFTCVQSMRNSPNILLTNLSVADLLLLVVCAPSCALEAYIGDSDVWLLGEAMCTLTVIVIRMVNHVSVLTMLATSFERYWAVCHPLKANYMCTNRRAVFMCLATWLAAIIITSPIYFWTTYHNNADVTYCAVRTGHYWTDIYVVAVTMLCFFIPMLVLTGLHTAMVLQLTSKDSILNKNCGEEDRRSRKHAVTLLGTVVIVFYVCLLPHRILNLVNVVFGPGYLMKQGTLYVVIIYFCRLMLHLNSAVNPIIYSAMSSKFRAAFWEVFITFVSRKPANNSTILKKL